MAFCFKIYGASYLQNLLEPLINPLVDQADDGPRISFEVDPARYFYFIFILYIYILYNRVIDFK